MNEKPFMAVSWAAWVVTAATWIGNHPGIATAIGLVITVLSASVSVTIALSKWKMEQLHLQQEICEECLHGNPPSHCPLAKRPRECRIERKIKA